MMQIECPWCGPREELEFRFGGESHVQRPGPAEEVSDGVWGDYLFGRQNPKGVHYERWLHHFGCRRWFNIARHTVSHRIMAVYQMHEPAPQFGGEDA
jgi:sarcosine oxidase, subunit delta